MIQVPELKDFLSILPALLMVGGGSLFLVAQFFFKSNDHRVLRFITGGILLLSLFFVVDGKNSPGMGNYFARQITLNETSMWLNVIYISTALLTIIASPRILNQHEIFFPEFYPLILFAVTGMFFMTTSSDLILIFVGLELLSVSLYILIGMAKNELSSLEATLKYFLLGAFSSGFMLMGIALLYGASGSTQLDVALRPVFQLNPNFELAVFSKLGFGLFLVGVCFKIALVPFHSWTPDVYEGALTTMTGFMASGPKAAAMGLLLVLYSYFPTIDSSSLWTMLLGIIAILSMTVGNVLALKQENLKRVLAYSSISHAGYVVAGIITGARQEVIYYLIMYSLMSIAGFSIIAYLENGKHQITFSSLKSLVSKKPFTAFGLLIVFFSLAGIPPLGGFWTKIFLFQRIAESDNLINRYLLIAGVINSAIAIYYYLRVTVSAFMNEEKGEATLETIPTSLGLTFASSVCILFILLSWIVFHPSAI
ncbi:MAG: NADH-quinone oxidoreductase subunit N [Leptospiraceae bacterium]|nr:NADH-quinone oxidoreductase subunit N [Leptospiraceae bacterium]